MNIEVQFFNITKEFLPKGDMLGGGFLKKITNPIQRHLILNHLIEFKNNDVNNKTSGQ